MMNAPLSIQNFIPSAQYRWADILHYLNIDVPPGNKHGPCPVCGGKDRFRFDDLEGRGTWFCNQCNPQAGDGLDLVTRVFCCSTTEAMQKILPCIGALPPVDVSCVATAVPLTSSTIEQRAHDILKRCISGPSLYLLAKQLDDTVQLLTDESFRIGEYHFGDGTAVFPLIDCLGHITGLQLINPNGQKSFLPGTRQSGSLIVLRHDEKSTPETIIVTEGVATGLAVARLTDSAPSSIFAAASASNMVQAALLLRRQYPNARMILAGDNDCQNPQGNIGELQAQKAALEVGGWVSLPPTPVNADWDDYRRQYGDEVAA